MFTARYSSRDGTNTDEYEKVISLIISFTIFGSLLASIFSVLSYSSSCYFHQLWRILPVCPDLGTPPFVWWCEDPLRYIVMASIQFVWCILRVFGLLPLIMIASSSTFLLQAIISNIK